MKQLELYLHIPFCIKKCAYCDFLSGPADAKEQQEYVDAMIMEIQSYRQTYEAYEIVTIFLGGGTPSVLKEEQIVAIFHALRQSFSIRTDCEITIEVNPGTVTADKLKTYLAAGVNRLSIGLQSVHNTELKLLGRMHTYETFLHTYEMAREAGFQNINIDLISAIPGQTAESWRETLKTAAQLNPEHISAYSLIVEEGTPFYERYHKGEGLPSEEEERKIYKETKEVLAAFGYRRYEISNYAKEGYACRHNLGYWDGVSYLGIGTGASSLIEHVRYEHTVDRAAYVTEIKEGRRAQENNRERLTTAAQMEEFMFLGLRKMCGVSTEVFAQKFGIGIETVYETVIRDLKEKGLLVQEQERLYLTERGIDISNYVFVQFLLEE